MRLTVNSELPEVREHLQTLYRVLNGDLTRPMTRIADLLENSTRKRFNTKTSPDGSRWAGLKPATLRAKAKKDMAARPIFGLSEQDRQDIRQSLADWLEKTWSKT